MATSSRCATAGHLDGHKRQLRLGGGGANTAIPLRHAGHDVALVAPVGADAVAEWLLAKVQSFGHRRLVDRRACRARAPARSCSSTPTASARSSTSTAAATPPRRSGSRALEADAVYVRSRDLDLAPRSSPSAPAARSWSRTCRRSRRGRAPRTSSSGPSPTCRRSSWPDPGRAAARSRGDTLRWVVVTRGERGASAFSAERAHRPGRPARERRRLDRRRRRLRGRPRPRARGRAADARRRCETAVAWGAAAVACAGLPDAETIEQPRVTESPAWTGAAGQGRDRDRRGRRDRPRDRSALRAPRAAGWRAST